MLETRIPLAESDTGSAKHYPIYFLMADGILMDVTEL
jgi:hypothetical protein